MNSQNARYNCSDSKRGVAATDFELQQVIYYMHCVKHGPDSELTVNRRRYATVPANTKHKLDIVPS